jgi:hypothetical protein
VNFCPFWPTDVQVEKIAPYLRTMHAESRALMMDM